MPPRIGGLPAGISLDDSRISILVGGDGQNGLEVIQRSDLTDLIAEFRQLRKAIVQNYVVRNIHNLDADGAKRTFRFEQVKETVVEYRNSSIAPIEIRIITISGRISQGTILLQPGAEKLVQNHVGFEYSTPDSAPSILEVIELE